MKILHLRASNFYGGPERQLHLHARRSEGTRFVVTVSSFTEAGESPEFIDVIKQDGIATHVFSVTSAYDRSAIGKLREYLRSEGIRILCTHDYRTHLIGYLAKRGLSVKWIAFSRGWTQDNLMVRTYHWVEKLLVRLADQIVAVSHSQKRRLMRYLIPEAKISVVHNAIDIEMLESIQAADLRARFEFAPDSVIAVSAGRFSREKGQATFVEAAAIAATQNPSLRIVMFGDGPDLEQIRHLVRERHLEDFVHCPGFERNMLACIRGADILVNPSLSEGLPNIVLEGMALGVPVLATAVGGVPELIVDRLSGRLVPAESPGALAEALLEMAGHAELRAQLVHVARDKVREEFSFEGQMSALAEIYDKVMQ